MMENGVTDAAHRSRVAEWMLQTVGKALALSMLAAVVFVVVAMVVQQPLILVGSGLIGPLVFAAVLFNATAPKD